MVKSRPEIQWWRVAFWLPKEATGGSHGKNLCIGVGAANAVGAIGETMKLYPMAEINGVNRHGSIANWPGGAPSADWALKTPLPGDGEDRV